ncbi:MAG: transporter substrate-binding domain-containing protein [Cyanobacteria bacterium]|nr:transporter substrate-binding domain-containing protein [Cyanobacteria bacterium CG_2015-16_32_12]NCO78914.1 transporter substrate-binding domain-containing protein [Cyanobacteria bacterium CG_2015-22_32_23]NCQ04991.1 transporter substrate-binding domain-containing protein [Cyanobacteria bacterium CG_2015-09_32_10]NCQ42977.1 transporter substrate-binding domain-containing protein [Cyanobacteria bacterium CG_2015-04_32_10]NCS84236.1 transporter substrate-binding domain-containing protein [Cya
MISQKLLFIIIAFVISIPVKVYSASWEEISKKGELVIGVKDNLRPLGYRDSQGNLRGFEIDVARRLALELLGSENAVKLIPLSNQERIQKVTDLDVDLAIASITVNTSRQRIVDFSDFYYLDGTGIIVKKGQINANIRDFNGKIGVIGNSRAIAQIQFNLPNLPLKEISSYQQALDSIESGEIQGFAGDITILTGWMQENSNYQLLPTVFGGYPLAIALPKGRQYQELRDKVNDVVRKLKQEGWLEERAKYWGLP